MVDSSIVLTGQTIAYTFYVLTVMTIVGWFSYQVTRDGKSKSIPPAFFYSFVAFLVVIGVSLHIVTHETIPWKPMDLERAKITPDQEFNITVENHKFYLPPTPMLVKVNEKVRFVVTSQDLTYGFGLFRSDNSMVFQMQVLPGHINDVMWVFGKPGVYSIRSTEYSGPQGIGMIVKDAVVVVE